MLGSVQTILWVDKLGTILLSSCSWHWAENVLSESWGDQRKCYLYRSGNPPWEWGWFLRTVTKSDEAQQCWPNTREQPSILTCLPHSVFTSTSYYRWGRWQPWEGKGYDRGHRARKCQSHFDWKQGVILGSVGLMNQLTLGRKSMGLGAEEIWVQIPGVPFPSCVTLGKFLFRRLFSCVQNRDNRVLTL